MDAAYNKAEDVEKDSRFRLKRLFLTMHSLKNKLQFFAQFCLHKFAYKVL